MGERLVAGEEHQGSAVSLGEIAADHLQAPPFVGGLLRRIGHALHHHQLDLPLVVEGAAKLHTLRGSKSQPAAGIGEGVVAPCACLRVEWIPIEIKLQFAIALAAAAWASGGKRGAGEDHRAHPAKELFAERLAHIHRGAGQTNPTPAATAAGRLHPPHAPRQPLLKPGLNRPGATGKPVGGGMEILPFGFG